MRRFLLVALVGSLGCNYYGPDNPPPPDVEPVYTLRRVDATDPGGLAVATCPAGTLIVAGGGDCVACSPRDPSAYVFGSNFSGAPTGTPNSFVTGCYPGCAHATAFCLSSNTSGTLVQGLLGFEAGSGVDVASEYRLVLEAKRAAGR